MAKVYFVREEISIEVPVGISVLEAEIRAGLAPVSYTHLGPCIYSTAIHR